MTMRSVCGERGDKYSVANLFLKVVFAAVSPYHVRVVTDFIGLLALAPVEQLGGNNGLDRCVDDVSWCERS